MQKPTEEQTEALACLGLSADQMERFCQGDEVVFLFPTQAEAGIGIAQLMDERVRCGIVSLKDPGGGLVSLARFRANASRVAKVFQKRELEIFGAAIINPKLAALLLRQSFVQRIVSCPDDLGGGDMEILARTFEVFDE